MNIVRSYHHRLAWTTGLLVTLLAASATPAQAPADYAPMSISMEDVPYPHPVSFLEFELYGQDVRLAYMNVAPAGQTNGRTVVLLHGGNFFAEYWADTIEVLRNEGFRVIATDRIGYGRSSKPIVPYTLHDMALHTKMVLEAEGISKAAIVGHSMGGMVASRFAFAYPDITTHVALVNSIGLTDSRLQRPWRDPQQAYESSRSRSYGAIRRNVERYFVTWDPKHERFIRILYGWTLSGDWPRLAMVRSRIGQMLYADPVVYDWPHIKAKALVIGGAEDGPSFRELAKHVADTIPNGELMLIDNVGHIPFLEAPDRFHPELIRFLKSDPTPYTEELDDKSQD